MRQELLAPDNFLRPGTIVRKMPSSTSAHWRTPLTKAVQQLIATFDSLSEAEKQTAAAEVLRRVSQLAPAEIPDESLVELADELFRELDALT